MTIHTPTSEPDRDGAMSGGSVVLWSGDAVDCSLLLRALAARGLPPVVVSDEPGVMAELAGLSRRGVDRCVLVVVEPADWGRLDELVVAVRAYHAGVYCWQFASGEGSARLTQLEPNVMEAGAGQANGRASAEALQDASDREAGPVGQIHKRSRPVDRLLVQAPGRELSTREIVTQQELTMLLGPVPGEAS